MNFGRHRYLGRSKHAGCLFFDIVNKLLRGEKGAGLDTMIIISGKFY